ncbi:WD40 repeat domain-containing protein [Rhizobium hainanense]|uniref:WD domain, G-beta repeat n=1 Tax=Rhizobium hainanense TaxID=52131 RepID=A0A1C3WK18_9HYPH|nr:WD40 repeat domain-containing protein [Rhizobium hainanense]SCB40196.1 WD domain, G-beta repeat [Rhizobium hainanense]
MNQQTAGKLSMFDLFARSWQRPAAVVDLRFNTNDTAVAFAGADGSLAIAPLADNESPEKRIRRSADFGQATIRPRKAPPPPLIETAALTQSMLPIAVGPSDRFVVANGDGELLSVDASGEIESGGIRLGRPVKGLDYHEEKRITALSDGAALHLSHDGGPLRQLESAVDGKIDAIAISPDGLNVAAATAAGLAIWQTSATTGCDHIRLPERPVLIRWTADNRWLACALETGGVALVEPGAKRIGLLQDFPTPVSSLCWSRPANALVAAGAFRIAAWSMETPPLADSRSGALTTGRTGYVAIERVAAHPSKDLVAASYANGAIVIARIGSGDELPVRHAGEPVTVMAWSADGNHLAIGATDGSAAIVTFPPQIFKS